MFFSVLCGADGAVSATALSAIVVLCHSHRRRKTAAGDMEAAADDAATGAAAAAARPSEVCLGTAGDHRGLRQVCGIILRTTR